MLWVIVFQRKEQDPLKSKNKVSNKNVLTMGNSCGFLACFQNAVSCILPIYFFCLFILLITNCFSDITYSLESELQTDTCIKKFSAIFELYVLHFLMYTYGHLTTS